MEAKQPTNEPDAKYVDAKLREFANKLGGFGLQLMGFTGEQANQNEQIDRLAKRLAERDAKIVELQWQLAELSEKHEKMAAWLKDKHAKEKQNGDKAKQN